MYKLFKNANLMPRKFLLILQLRWMWYHKKLKNPDSNDLSPIPISLKTSYLVSTQPNSVPPLRIHSQKHTDLKTDQLPKMLEVCKLICIRIF